MTPIVSLRGSRFFRPGAPFLGAPRPFLGQDFEDLVNLDGWRNEIVELLGKVPDESLGKYQSKFDDCEKKIADGGLGLITGGKCLYDLVRELRGFLKDEPTPKPPKATPTAPAESGFPIVPVAIGGAVILGALFFLTR